MAAQPSYWTKTPATTNLGARALAAVVLSFDAFIAVVMGAIAIPLAAVLDTLPADGTVLAFLYRMAPVFVVAGIVHVAAAIGLILGRRWGTQLAVLVGVTGIAVAVVGAIAIATGNDPFAALRYADPAPAAATGYGILAVMFASYAVIVAAARRAVRTPAA